jgi:hypothetical protein
MKTKTNNKPNKMKINQNNMLTIIKRYTTILPVGARQVTSTDTTTNERLTTMSKVYDINHNNSDYAGYGRAYAAEINGEIIGIRYYRNAYKPLPTWLRVMTEASHGYTFFGVRTSGEDARLCQLATQCEDCPRQADGRDYQQDQLMSIALSTLATEQRVQGAVSDFYNIFQFFFPKGSNILTGTCSCWQFIPDRGF